MASEVEFPEPEGDGSRLPDLQPAELPELPGPFWKMTGPGAVLVGLSIGAGEIVIWPRLAAQYGAVLAWAAALGVFLQLWVNIEVGRWTVATGESVYTGFARIWRPFGAIFILLNILGWLAPGWGRTSGLALKALLLGPAGWGSDAFWTAVTFAFVALLLFGPKLVYQSVERTIEVLVVLVTLGLLSVAIVVGTGQHWADLGRGLISFGQVPEGISVKDLFIAIVFAGAGGTANLFYTFYLRDKQIGMGKHIPQLQNPLRGRMEATPTTGFTFEDTPENAKLFQRWLRYIKQDQTLFFYGLNTVTIMLFIFGSLAVLHSQTPPVVPQTGSLIWDEAQILGQVWGSLGRTVFLLVGFFTLFSTQLALVDGVARSLADIIYTNYAKARSRSLAWWYLVVAGSWMVVGVVLTWWLERKGVTELGFLFNAAYMGGFAMAIYVPLLLIMNFRFLPQCARPRWLCATATAIVGVIYIAFAIASILWTIRG